VLRNHLEPAGVGVRHGPDWRRALASARELSRGQSEEVSILA
jgi:hypothetical protein